MKTGLVICMLFLSGVVGATEFNDRKNHTCRGDAETGVESVVKVICNNDRSYKLAYDRKRSVIKVIVKGRATILHKIPRARDPALVGMDAIIGFLPDKLQPYRNRNVLIYFSSIRTSSGDGRGQCGSGAETYMNFLDVSSVVPRIRSSLLIGSCNESIELDDQDMANGKFGDISLYGDTLALNFLFHREVDDKAIGLISPDFKKILFK